MHPALPSFLRVPRSSPRTAAVLAGAIGSGACAYSRLYPNYDEGSLRVLMGVLAAVAGALVVWFSFKKADTSLACPKAVGLGCLFGALVPMVPAAYLCVVRPDGLVLALVLGVVTGLPTGLLYGIALAILVSCVHPHGRPATLDGSNRAWRAAGLWTLACTGLALARHREGSRAVDVANHVDVGLCLLGILACAAALAAIVAQVWIVSTRRWLARLQADRDPHLRIRRRTECDATAGLPWVSGSMDTVVEWAPQTRAAYRENAAGIAICFVEDPRRI